MEKVELGVKSNLFVLQEMQTGVDNYVEYRLAKGAAFSVCPFRYPMPVQSNIEGAGMVLQYHVCSSNCPHFHIDSVDDRVVVVLSCGGGCQINIDRVTNLEYAKSKLIKL